MARRSTQSRELIRLTPVQFSISVSVVVLLLACAGIAGYFYGLQEAAKEPEQVSMIVPDIAPASDSVSARSETPAPVTFYTELTEPKDETPAPVQQQRPPETQERARTGKDEPQGGHFLMLQVASYRRRAAAADLLESLSSEGYSGTIQYADLGERGEWYRVRIGPYASEEEANGVLGQLRKDKDLKGYIVR